MSRIIKFRGKNIETGKWVYGFYTQGGYIQEDGTKKVRHIIHSDMLYDVEKHTIGQYTGLQDKNGVEIYEGDVIESRNSIACFRHVIRYDNNTASFVGVWRDNITTLSQDWILKYNKEVISDIPTILNYIEESDYDRKDILPTTYNRSAL